MPGPFDSEHVDAWSDEVADVESLNAPVSDAILSSLEAVRRDARLGPEQLRSHCMLVLGPAGTGKTHLFARVRRKSGARSAFVLLRPEVGTELTPRLVLAAMVDALRRRPAHHEETQLDILVGAALSLLNGRGSSFPSAQLDELRNAPAAVRDAQVNAAVDAVADQYPEIDPLWLHRLLLVPAATSVHRRATLAWLSGREPDATQLERLGLKEPLPDSSVMPAIKTLAIIAAQSTPLLMMFDQLENLFQDEETNSRVAAYSSLVMELSDSVRGLVIVQMALDAEWAKRISPVLSTSHRSRLEAHRQLMVLPTEAQRRELIDAWTRKVPETERKPAPWPLSAKAWASWGTGPGVTPRSLMIACRDALAHPDAADQALAAEPTESELDARLGELWKEAESDARAVARLATEETRSVDAERVLGGLLGALRLAGAPNIASKKGRQPHDLRVGSENATTDVYLVQQGHHRSVAAALQKATAATAQRRVVAIREAARPFSPSWSKCTESLHALQSTERGTWLELLPNQVNDLLALSGLLASARSQDLTGPDGKAIPEAAVHDWVKRQLRPAEWPAIAAILGGARSVQEAVGSPPDKRPPADSHQTHGTVASVLMRLRLASVDRLVREARAVSKTTTRADVLAELRALTGVRWFGRAIVSWSQERR